MDNFVTHHNADVLDLNDGFLGADLKGQSLAGARVLGPISARCSADMTGSVDLVASRLEPNHDGDAALVLAASTFHAIEALRRRRVSLRVHPRQESQELERLRKVRSSALPRGSERPTSCLHLAALCGRGTAAVLNKAKIH